MRLGLELGLAVASELVAGSELATGSEVLEATVLETGVDDGSTLLAGVDEGSTEEDAIEELGGSDSSGSQSS